MHRTTWSAVLLTVAHEVGHVALADLGMHAELHRRITSAAVPQERVAAWSSWEEEVFAGLFAVVLCGGAVPVARGSS